MASATVVPVPPTASAAPPPADALQATAIVRFHDGQVRERDWPVMTRGPAATGPAAASWEWIAANHRYNGLIWREGARMGRAGALPEDVAAGKRLVDRYDQKRQDAIEALDEALLARLHGVARLAGARLSSESAGMMIDRMSMLALKIHHMRLLARQVDAGPEHVRVCAGKLERLRAQRKDLAGCLDVLLREARAGLAWFKVCRQVRMAS